MGLVQYRKQKHSLKPRISQKTRTLPGIHHRPRNASPFRAPPQRKIPNPNEHSLPPLEKNKKRAQQNPRKPR